MVLSSGKVNILLVDDQDANLLALEAVLEDLGQNLVRASSGEEALWRLQEDDFAVVLLDVQMHDLDGFETAKLVRSREQSRHTPIIFVTAYDSDRFPVERAYSLGAVDYLVKPLVPVILRAKVAGFVELFQKTQQVQLQAELLRQGERREFDRKQQEQREWFRVTLASIGDAVITTDTEGRVTFLNPVAQSLTGWGQEEATGQPLDGVFRIIHEESRQPVESPTLRALRDGLVVGLANHSLLIAKDGTERIIDDNAAPIRNDKGEVAGVVLVFRDMTAHREAEVAVRASEVRYRRLFETAKDGILILDGNTVKIIDANPFMTEMLGYSHDEFLGKELWEIGLFTDKRESQAIYQELQEKGYVRYENLPLESRSGQKVEVEFVSNVYAENHHQVVQCNIRDITERSRLDRELQRHAEELAEAGRRKDEFLSMLAHELRNPLAPIRTGLQVLKLADNDREALEQARAMMERQVTHLSRIVDDLLDVSRVNKGKLALKPERLDLGRLVRVIATDHRPAFDQAGLTFHVEVPELPVWVTGDPTRLTQVMDNLWQNALKFTDRGGEVGVRLAVDRESQQAVLTVWDTGMGLEPDLLPRLFETFTQADRSLDRTKGGLGLGLSLVKGLVELHGGQVHAASAGPNKGSEFTITLPLEPEPAALSKMPTAAPPQVKRRLRILVVEDNKDAADSLRMLLELYGYEVSVAYSGPAGVKAACEFPPDVVLCDIGLPGMDGYGVVAALRRDPATSKARMIAVTGYGGDEDRRRSQEAGFDQHLTKPVDALTLMAVLTPSAN